MRKGLSGNMVSLVMQEARKRCGSDMTESKRPVENAKNPIMKVVPRLAYDHSVEFIEIGQGNHRLQSVEESTELTSKFFMVGFSMPVSTYERAAHCIPEDNAPPRGYAASDHERIQRCLSVRVRTGL